MKHTRFDIGKRWHHFETRTTSGFSPGQKKMWNILIFLLRFLMLAIPFHFILWLNFDAHTLQVITARSVSFLLSLFSVSHDYKDIFLLVPLDKVSWTIEIIKDCVGWKSFMAASGLIFAVRNIQMEKRIIGIVLAAPLIFIGNIIRIFTSIYLTTIFGFSYFDIIHGILWQAGMIALVIFIWLFWLEKIAKPKLYIHHRY